MVDRKIFYGIKTGLNEAFVIDASTRDRLVAVDPRSVEVLKPFLAGRDIKRYEQPKSSKYLILAERGIDIKQYPSILEHLSKFKAKLESRAGSGLWYELQASPGDTNKFEKAKIMYPDISKNLNFTIDDCGYYSVNTVYNIGSESKGLLGYLNSKLFLFYFRAISNSIRGGYLRFFTEYLIECPVPVEIEPIQVLVEQIVTLKKNNPLTDTSEIETQIDQLVYQLYNLTEEEISIIENT